MEDAELLLEWANDSTTRQNSFSSEQIDYNDHIEYLKRKLDSSDSAWYILCVNGEDVGQARIEMKDNEAIISYSIAPKHRNKGYGKKILVLLEKQIKSDYPFIDILIGKTKINNGISIRKFEQLNYQKSTDFECIEYRKHI